MTETIDGSEIRRTVSRAAAEAIRNACKGLGYECVFVGEMACFGYGGSRPPTKIELMIIPKDNSKTPVDLGDFRRLIAQQPTGVAGGFTVSPLDISFQHNQYTGRWKAIVIDITIASKTDARDVKPLQIINDLQYACPQFILVNRLKLWVQAHDVHPASLSTKVRNLHRDYEIDPLLRHLVKTRTTFANWRGFEVGHIVKYYKAYPSSAELWIEVGLDPKPPVSKPVPVPRPVVVAPAAPPPYHAQATAPSAISSSGNPPKLDGRTATPSLKALKPISMTPPTHAGIINVAPVEMLVLAAQSAIDLLRSMFLPSAIFGSLACFLYGTYRPPNDVDILVLPPPGCDLLIEEVKMLLVVKDPEHFFMVPPEDPKAGYNHLYYRLEKKGPGSCKVDLVFPGTYDLPRLPTSMIDWSEGLPLIPFSLLLLQKLQNWDHHGQALEKLEVLKQRLDVEDLRGMLEQDLMEELRYSSPWADEKLFSWTFLQDSLSRVHYLCDAYPDLAKRWRHVGFIQ